MKTVIVLCCSLIVGELFADAVKPDVVKLSPDERKALHEKVVMEKHGGFVTVKGTPAGKVLIINSQKKVAVDNFDVSKQKALSRVRGVVKFSEGLAATPATAAKMKSDAGADFAIFIVDDKSLPPSLIAPEEKWGIMNVAALEPNAATPEIVRIRARNEFARVFAMTCGGFASQFKAPLTNNVKEIGDLDNCLADLPVDLGARVASYLDFCGVKPEQRVTYRKAVKDGWASAPTNEFQKAIWKEMHEIPSEPIKIKPENHPAK